METTYLKHHGIKGMKWGDRNGPPYPLKPGAHSAAEKRAAATYGSATKKKVKYGGMSEEERKRVDAMATDGRKLREAAAAQAAEKYWHGGPSTKSASEMNTAELAAYNNRREQEEKYKKFQKQDYEKSVEERTKNLRAIKDITKDAQDTHALISKQVNDYYDARHKRQKAAMDLSKMSDDDLRRVINRLDLERRYRDLTPPEISKGERAWKRILNTTGTALPLANYALDTAIKIKTLID